MFRRIARLLAAFVMITSGVVVGVGATAGAAHADECYSWSRTLSQGASGNDVTQLQIRVAGWVTSGERLSYDGQYGARTTAAVRKFQSVYGLTADGIAGPHDLQQALRPPGRGLHARPLLLRRAQPLQLRLVGRRRVGGHRQGERAEDHVEAGGDAPRARRRPAHRLQRLPFLLLQQRRGRRGRSSRHLYGDAADLTGSPSLCRLAQEARTHGFSEILGPGYPDHNDHAHVALDPSPYWSAPNCGI